MADYDYGKVLKGLECHAEVNCVECPYRDGWRTCSFGETLLADAIALIKEQQETIELQGSLLTLAHAAMSHGKKEGTRDIARPGRN